MVTIIHKNLSAWKERNLISNIKGRSQRLEYVKTEIRFIISIRTGNQNDIEILGSEERKKTCKSGNRNTIAQIEETKDRTNI